MKIVAAWTLLPVMVAAIIPSTPDLGKAEGRCRNEEPGPAVVVQVIGLKDRTGNLKLEVYPANDSDFLADDNILISAGKVFRRVEVPVPQTGPVSLCIRVPGPGSYALSLLHDRDRNRRFGWTVDGIGFSANPHLGWSKPRASMVRLAAGAGVTHTAIVMNYRRGLGVAPLDNAR